MNSNDKIIDKSVFFLPLGGAGEIGMNCYLYNCQDKWLIVDLGVTFNDESMPYADLILPDLQYIFERKKDIVGMILTHAHEDHIGGVPYLYENLGDIPIFATSFTSSVLKRKFSKNKKSPNINTLKYNQVYSLGPFNVEILALTHSIPEPNAILIKTKDVNIFHSGDWKIDPFPLVGKPIDEEKIKRIKKEKIHTLVCDSTNIFNASPSGSEQDVRKTLDKVFNEHKNGKIVVTCFASNIARLETIGYVAKKHKRSCIFLGRSLKKIYDAALENDYLKTIPKFLNQDDGRLISDENIVLVCTGSQGESRAALYKLVNGMNANYSLNKYDLVIFSSREIPGNEKQISIIKNNILKSGAKYIDDQFPKVHVSGHPSKKELEEMYEWVNPDLLIPIHGEFSHLNEHIRFAKSKGIKNTLLVENGDLACINTECPTVTETVNFGRKILFGNRMLSKNDKILNNLKNSNFNCSAQIVFVINNIDDVLIKPIIFVNTIIDESDKLENEKLQKKIIDIFNESNRKSITDDILKNYLKTQIRSTILKDYGIRPLTSVRIVRV